MAQLLLRRCFALRERSGPLAVRVKSAAGRVNEHGIPHRKTGPRAIQESLNE
jgi:hypothetical protein